MTETITVIIPAYNEENSIGNVIRDLPDFVHEIIVVNNNSTDATEKNAKDAGATVLTEFKAGYIDMPNIRTTNSRADSASQEFFFYQRNISFGYIFQLVK